MSAFTGPLMITELPDANGWLWRLEQALIYEVGALGSGRKIEVHPGFVTDGATVPRLLWWVLPAWGTYSRAAVLHDHLCTLLELGTPHPEARTRQLADAVFFEAMSVLGVNTAIKWAMWIGVRIGAAYEYLTGHKARTAPYDINDII